MNTAPTTIPDAFTKPGYAYRLIERTGDTAIYEQTHRETGRVVAYEAMVIQRIAKDTILPGGVFRAEGSEFLPSSEKWGVAGWTTRTLAKARLYVSEKGQNK